MGLLDLPAPLFAWLDAALGGLAPASLRLVLWALVAAAFSMGLYVVLSPQRQIARAKADALAARGALDRFDGVFGEAWLLIRAVLKTLLVWLSNAYGHAFPGNEADVAIRTVPQDLEAHLETIPPALASSGPSHHQIVVLDRTGQIVDRVPWHAPVPTIHKREWWNLLLGNPAGYLPDDSPLERLDLDLPARQYLPVGPDWLKLWYVPFFGVLLLASLAIKVVARIE